MNVAERRVHPFERRPAGRLSARPGADRLVAAGDRVRCPSRPSQPLLRGPAVLGATRDLALAALDRQSLRGRPSGLVETAATKGVLPAAPRPRCRRSAPPRASSISTRPDSGVSLAPAITAMILCFMVHCLTPRRRPSSTEDAVLRRSGGWRRQRRLVARRRPMYAAQPLLQNQLSPETLAAAGHTGKHVDARARRPLCRPFFASYARHWRPVRHLLQANFFGVIPCPPTSSPS